MFFGVFWGFVFLGVCVVIGAAQQTSRTSFSCDGRTSGYYADVSTGCQVYHMCDGLGRQFTYRCPNKTLFQQRMLICDHWYMVNCSKAEEDYSANLLIGQQGKPFVEDLYYHRTPRPDLINPSQSDYNTYRHDQRENQSPKNIVGADDNDAKATTDEDSYFPPSHWSTEYAPQATTPTAIRRNENVNGPLTGFTEQTYYRTTYNSGNRTFNNLKPKGKGLSLESVNRDGNRFTTKSKISRKGSVSNGDSILKEQPLIPQHNGMVNFPSSFKATTPVYPKTVDVDLSKFSQFAEEPPFGQVSEITNLEDTEVNKQITNFDSLPQSAKNFPSNFQATTPVYPKTVNVDLSKFSELPVDQIPVDFQTRSNANPAVKPSEAQSDTQFQSGGNFPSSFRATTPVYPKEVGIDLSKFSEFAELPPEQTAGASGVSVNFASNFKATTPVYPQTVELTSPLPDEAGLLPPLPYQVINKDVQDVDNNIKINFPSNFQATTPDYPKSVEATSPDPGQVGLIPPQQTGEQSEGNPPNQTQPIDNQKVPGLVLDFLPPKFDPNFIKRADNFEATTVSSPAQFFQPPIIGAEIIPAEEIEPSVLGNTFNSKQLTEYMLTMKPEQLKDLRDMWHIPDYDFPLDTGSRPGYDSVFSSFQAKPITKRLHRTMWWYNSNNSDRSELFVKPRETLVREAWDSE